MNVTLNASPKRRRHDSMNEIGRRSQRAVWMTGGSGGPGGSVGTPQAYAAVARGEWDGPR